MVRAWVAMAGFAVVIVGWTGVAAAQHRGVQFTPDDAIVLVNKDVGTERWAIALTRTLGDRQRLPSDGGEPAFVLRAARHVNAAGLRRRRLQSTGARAAGIQATRTGIACSCRKSRHGALGDLAERKRHRDRQHLPLGRRARVRLLRSDGAPNEFDCSGADKSGTSCPRMGTRRSRPARCRHRSSQCPIPATDVHVAWQRHTRRRTLRAPNWSRSRSAGGGGPSVPDAG